jgi:CheY-specific phosphatase CheX
MTGELPMSELGTELVDGFLAVVVRYLRTTVGVDAVVAAIGEPATTTQTIAVALDFQGDVRGPVTWVFPRPIALELVRRLMSDPDPDPETATDGATELANILTGRASEALEKYGFQCEIGVPRVHIGDLPGGVAVRMTISCCRCRPPTSRCAAARRPGPARRAAQRNS